MPHLKWNKFVAEGNSSEMIFLLFLKKTFGYFAYLFKKLFVCNNNVETNLMYL